MVFISISNGSEDDEKKSHEQFEIHNFQVDCAASAMETIQLLTIRCGLMRIYEVIHSPLLSVTEKGGEQTKQLSLHHTHTY